MVSNLCQRTRQWKLDYSPCLLAISLRYLKHVFKFFLLLFPKIYTHLLMISYFIQFSFLSLRHNYHGNIALAPTIHLGCNLNDIWGELDPIPLWIQTPFDDSIPIACIHLEAAVLWLTWHNNIRASERANEELISNLQLILCLQSVNKPIETERVVINVFIRRCEHAIGVKVEKWRFSMSCSSKVTGRA